MSILLNFNENKKKVDIFGSEVILFLKNRSKKHCIFNVYFQGMFQSCIIYHMKGIKLLIPKSPALLRLTGITLMKIRMWINLDNRDVVDSPGQSLIWLSLLLEPTFVIFYGTFNPLTTSAKTLFAEFRNIGI